ncbi:MAG TPA: penicillin acylase family protein [Spirochaetia bacterium]|nr:penicillin acylase family protein [Spirochaetia bacterium]
MGAGTALAVIALLFLAVLWVVRSSFPRTRGTLYANGLQSGAEVLRDRYGVPHIRAASLHDLYFAQGYVTAQDRFWQMDFWRRIGAGRLSEYFGKSTLGADVYLRTLGFRHIADQEYAAMDPDTRAAFDAYAQGVNAYLAGRSPGSLSLEYTLLQLEGVHVSIEPWVPQDSITWLKLMALNLGSNMSRELYTIELIQKMGMAKTAELLGTYRYGEMPVIVSDSELPTAFLGALPPGERGGRAAPTPLPATALSAVAQVPTGSPGLADLGALGLGHGPGVGSNNWVISGSRTASGKPILANDPHLEIQMPSIWYETDLYCSAPDAPAGSGPSGPLHVRGFTFPGTPGIVIGHNDRIAWGVTNMFPDVQDLYIERLNPDNPNQYEVNGKWADMAVSVESISVLHEDPVRILVRRTRHGPVMTDTDGYAGYKGFTLNPQTAFPKGLGLTALALRWTALQPNFTFRSVLMLDKARNFQEFRDALRYFDVPSQNFIYADVDGNIGYQSEGLVPVRGRGNGAVPSPGWTDDFEWKGFIPFDDLPYSYNPPKGYIVTANNPVTSPSYRHFIGDNFDFGYRARRIAEMIEGARGKITVADVKAMQADTLNLSARELMPYLKTLTLDGDAARGRGILAAWDMRMNADSAGAAVYGFFWQALMENVVKENIPQKLWSVDTVLDDNSRLMNAVAEALPDPVAPFWDDPLTPDVKETRDAVLAAALQKGMQAGIRALGRDPTLWRWGKVHTATFRNQTFGKSGIRLIERIFNRGPVPVGGGLQEVVSSDWSPDAPFDTYLVSSMRQIVDLSDLDSSVAMNATGQSGHVGDGHYADMVRPWAEVSYHSTGWSDTALKAAGYTRLELRRPPEPQTPPKGRD